MNESKLDVTAYKLVTKDDVDSIKQIADWYKSEWNIPIEITVQKLSALPADGIPFQIMMTINDVPIATGGMYNHVGLLDKEPRFKKYAPWLALVYTKNEHRNNGYGALLCNYIEGAAQKIGTNELYLFTYTAETLYKRLGWQELERVLLNERELVIMTKKFC